MGLESKVTDEITQEKSLFEVYLLSFRLPIPVQILLPSILVSAAIFAWGFGASEEVRFASIKHAKELIDFCINFSATIMGFLIAGFTMFATLTNPRVFVEMARRWNDAAKMSWLKITFAVFMHVFVHFCALLCAALLIKLFSFSGGPVSYVVESWFANSKVVKGCLSVFSIAIFSGWIFYVSLMLGRFVFNIYKTSMLSIAIANEELIRIEQKP